MGYWQAPTLGNLALGKGRRASLLSCTALATTLIISGSLLASPAFADDQGPGPVGTPGTDVEQPDIVVPPIVAEPFPVIPVPLSALGGDGGNGTPATGTAGAPGAPGLPDPGQPGGPGGTGGGASGTGSAGGEGGIGTGGGYDPVTVNIIGNIVNPALLTH
ncbi:hypothetical protein [Taklimakanibacter deserti]|uniref:hypothetical protein n=1 Tax=Taklimakanibacter deserti TaxID=2267839 RepID=UPI0013C506C9